MEKYKKLAIVLLVIVTIIVGVTQYNYKQQTLQQTLVEGEGFFENSFNQVRIFESKLNKANITVSSIGISGNFDGDRFIFTKPIKSQYHISRHSPKPFSSLLTRATFIDVKEENFATSTYVVVFDKEVVSTVASMEVDNIDSISRYEVYDAKDGVYLLLDRGKNFEKSRFKINGNSLVPFTGLIQ